MTSLCESWLELIDEYQKENQPSGGTNSNYQDQWNMDPCQWLLKE